MELFILLAPIGFLLFVFLRMVGRNQQAASAHRRMQAQRRQAEEYRRQQLRRTQLAAQQRQTRLLRGIQRALSELHHAPDFRRAANWASHGGRLPPATKHRLFRQFRHHMLRHFSARLAAGEDPNALLESLRELLRHLGIPTFEADYIRAEAERGLPQPSAPAAPTYERQLTDAQRDHENRLRVLRSLASLDNETRQQLIEAEESRFRQSLLELGADAP